EPVIRERAVAILEAALHGLPARIAVRDLATENRNAARVVDADGQVRPESRITEIERVDRASLPLPAPLAVPHRQLAARGRVAAGSGDGRALGTLDDRERVVDRASTREEPPRQHVVVDV